MSDKQRRAKALEQHAEALQRFRAFCEAEWRKPKDTRIDPSEEQDWFSLSLGFFVALGVPSDDAHLLGLEARYQQQYWEPNT